MSNLVAPHTAPDTARDPTVDRKAPLKRLRLIGRFEGTTLLILLFLAVPLKHLFQVPQAVSIMGPLHGLSLLAYVVVLIETVAAGLLNRRESLRTLLACFLPFGPFFNDGLLRRKLGAEISDDL